MVTLIALVQSYIAKVKLQSHKLFCFMFTWVHIIQTEFNKLTLLKLPIMYHILFIKNSSLKLKHRFHKQLARSFPTCNLR